MICSDCQYEDCANCKPIIRDYRTSKPTVIAQLKRNGRHKKAMEEQFQGRIIGECECPHWWRPFALAEFKKRLTPDGRLKEKTIPPIGAVRNEGNGLWEDGKRETQSDLPNPTRRTA